VLPARRFVGATTLGPYGDFIVQVDWTVGQLLLTLDGLDLERETLFVYTSDNGSFMYRRAEPVDHVTDSRTQAYHPEHHTPNGPWRGTKADIWEGGHRVPFFVRWPGVVAPGSETNETICLTDLFATVADVLGEPLPRDAAEDSFSLLPLLRGTPETFDRGPVIHHSADGMFAVRDGRFKLVAGSGSGGREAPKGEPFGRPYGLFDIEADPGETRDSRAGRPELAARLEAVLEELRSAGRTRP